MRKLFCIATIIMCIMVWGNHASAGTFTLLAATGRLRLDDGQSWGETYNTTRGSFKIQFKKRSNVPLQKKYHLTIWWNDQEIANGYSPKIEGGYRFEIFREDVTDRIFVSFETIDRIVIMGYDPVRRKLQKYIDSNDYSSAPTPQLFVNSKKELLLSYASTGNSPPPLYNFLWNEQKAWFEYKDVTRKPKPKPVQKPPKPLPEPIPDSGSGGSEMPDFTDDTGDSSDNEYTESATETIYTSMQPTIYEEELYYEETVVVGS